MKVSRHKVSADVLERRLRGLATQLREYPPGNIELLSHMAATVVMAYEYWISRDASPVLRFDKLKETIAYLAGHFQTQTCLILLWNGKYYSYTRLAVCKGLRAFVFHVDQKDRSKKDEALRNFVFEDCNTSTLEFAITHNWLITPGLYSSTGNTDSGSPYKEAWKVANQREKKVTIIESIVLNVLTEFWFISSVGSYVNTHRILWDISKEELVNRFGENMGTSAYDVICWHKSLKHYRSGMRHQMALTRMTSLDSQVPSA